MKVIGVTGGIGSGKSVVMEILERDFGAKVIIADELGHSAMSKGSETYMRMLEEFGEGILSCGGEIDRKKLARILLSEPSKLEIQNSIVHPFVRSRIEYLLDGWKAGGEKLAAIESAILVESGCGDYCDEIWYVRADERVRMERLIKLRNYSKEKAGSFIDRQLSDDRYMEICDRIIENDSDIEKLYKQLKKSVEQFMSV